MDVEASLRLKEDEIKKLKAARAKDATRLKAAASKAKDKALAEQKRAHNLHITELGKEVGDLKASKSLVEKEVVRCNRRVNCLEADLAERELQRQQASKDYLWLQNEHAEVELNMAILRKEHEALKKELADRRRNTDALKERHTNNILLPACCVRYLQGALVMPCVTAVTRLYSTVLRTVPFCAKHHRGGEIYPKCSKFQMEFVS
jgi:hypothetical protein